MNIKQTALYTALGLGAVGGGFLCYKLYQTSDSYTSKVYVEKVIPAITKQWSSNALLVRAHPDMMERNPESLISRQVSLFRQGLGNMRQLESCDGYAATVQTKNDHARVTANYKCNIHFEKGDGIVNIGLLQTPKEEWRIFSFSVQSLKLQ